MNKFIEICKTNLLTIASVLLGSLYCVSHCVAVWFYFSLFIVHKPIEFQQIDCIFYFVLMIWVSTLFVFGVVKKKSKYIIPFFATQSCDWFFWCVICVHSLFLIDLFDVKPIFKGSPFEQELFALTPMEFNSFVKVILVLWVALKSGLLLLIFNTYKQITKKEVCMRIIFERIIPVSVESEFDDSSLEIINPPQYIELPPSYEE